MKLCRTCHEEFADKFSFCPVEGTLSGTDGNGNYVQNVIARLPGLQRDPGVLFECADEGCKSASLEGSHPNADPIAGGIFRQADARANYEEATMKFCVKCREQSSDEFRFRARDGAPVTQRATDAIHGLLNIADLDRPQEILASELKELLRQSRVPSGSPQLYQRVMADYVDMMRQET
jgi:hypothetical protein